MVCLAKRLRRGYDWDKILNVFDEIEQGKEGYIEKEQEGNLKDLRKKGGLTLKRIDLSEFGFSSGLKILTSPKVRPPPPQKPEILEFLPPRKQTFQKFYHFSRALT